MAYVRQFGWPAAAVAVLGLMAVVTTALPKTKKPAPRSEFFNEPVLRTFKFELLPSELARLSQSPRSYVTGQLVEAGQVLTNIGIRLRGHGSFRTLEERPN